MELREDIEVELDKLLNKADQWPSHFNLEALGGFILTHPQIVGRDELLFQKLNREYKERIKIGTQRNN